MRNGDLDDEEFPDFLSVASGGSLSRKPMPHALKAASRLKSGKKKGNLSTICFFIYTLHF